MRYLRQFRNWSWRLLTGWCWTHTHYPEDMGGVIYNCCEHCNWVGDDPIVYFDFQKECGRGDDQRTEPKAG